MSGPPEPESTAQPCNTPFKAQLAVLDGDGKVVTRVTSGDDGRFQLDLPPVSTPRRRTAIPTRLPRHSR